MPVSSTRIPALVVAVLVVLAPLANTHAQTTPSDDALAQAVDADDSAALKAAGPEVMSRLARLYAQSDEGPSLILKLSDVAFLSQDVESERRYRERYYGSLNEP
jgi:hypothetical protein